MDLRSWKRATTRCRVRVFSRDVVVSRPRVRHINTDFPMKHNGKRQAITCLSGKAKANLIFTARNAVGFTHFLTLTYGTDFPRDGRVVKAHLAAFRKRLMRAYPELGALWWMEFQERGAPHFHLVLNVRLDKDWVRRNWSDVVGGTDGQRLRTKIEKIRKPHAVGAYAAKYAAKAEQKQVPEGFERCGRFWGVFGELDRGLLAEGESEQGGELEVVSRCLRRAIGAEGGGRLGYTYRGLAVMALTIASKMALSMVWRC